MTKIVPITELGKCSIYVKHARGFDGTLRPAQDSAPDVHGWLTEEQVRELRDLIRAKVLRMTRKNGGGR